MITSIPLETLPSLVREFASYKSVIQNASEKTVSEYLLDLRTFFRFLRARDLHISVDSADFDKIDIREIDLELRHRWEDKRRNRCDQSDRESRS